MSPTAIQIVSDLHLETQTAGGNFVLPQTAPNLALLGDIGKVADIDDRLFSFLEAQLRRYWNVFFLLGNHEPLGTSWPAAKAAVRRFAERMERLRARSTVGRFVFLDQTRYDVDATLTVLGCTLFSRIAADEAVAVASRLVDFRHIRDWDVHAHNDAHAADLGWLNAQVAAIARDEPHRRIAVFTHHCPTLDARAADARHAGSAVSSGFVTDLRGELCWTSPAVVLWAFGHTHFSCDFVDTAAGVRVVANQRGYAGAPKAAFDGQKCVYAGEEAVDSVGDKGGEEAEKAAIRSTASA